MTDRQPNQQPIDPSWPPASHQVLPVIEEALEIHREREVTSTVRVRKEVHAQTVPVSGHAVRESVQTFRVPVNRAVDARQAPWQTEDAWVIPVYAEKLVPQLFLTEELHVRRQRDSVAENGSTVLRREEVVVERLDPETQTWVRQALQDLPPKV